MFFYTHEGRQNFLHVTSGGPSSFVESPEGYEIVGFWFRQGRMDDCETRVGIARKSSRTGRDNYSTGQFGSYIIGASRINNTEQTDRSRLNFT